MDEGVTYYIKTITGLSAIYEGARSLSCLKEFVQKAFKVNADSYRLIADGKVVEEDDVLPPTASVIHFVMLLRGGMAAP